MLAADARGLSSDYLELTDPDLGPGARRRAGPAAGRRPRRQHPTHRQRRDRCRPLGRERPMMRTMLKSKIHRATVTQADLHYVGSVTVDEDLLDAADLLPGEQVAIVDVTNGARLETYVIPGERGSGVIGINGAAAHLVHPGDLVILIATAAWTTPRRRRYIPRVVHVDAANRIVEPGRRPGAAPEADLGLTSGAITVAEVIPAETE